MPRPKPPVDPDRPLINKLTVGEARHLLAGEGGPRTLAQGAIDLASVAIVAAFTFRAISAGNATAWHLFLPMVAEYLTLMLALPMLYAVLQHPGLRKDGVQALRLWIGFFVVAAIVEGVRAHEHGVPWQKQLSADGAAVWRWIADAGMHWPMLAAALGMAVALPGRVMNLYNYGPPFSGVSLGCGMRVAVMFLGALALPWAMEDATRMAWTLWTMILIAELLSIWMLWDVQKELEKVDGPQRRGE
jgi:hypothetical protein